MLSRTKVTSGSLRKNKKSRNHRLISLEFFLRLNPMLKNSSLVFCIVWFFAVSCCVSGTDQSDLTSKGIEIARYENEFSYARIQPARISNKKGFDPIFECPSDLHYYAN